MQFITRDYETYWAADYTLSKMSTSSYVFDPRFEVILVSVKINNGKTVYLTEPQWRRFTEAVDWSNVGILGHHSHFDGLIDAHYYGIRPAFWFDTLSMSRAITGSKHKHSLDVLAPRWKCGEKGKEVLNTKGLRAVDFSPEAFARYGMYSVNDTELTYSIFQKMMTHAHGLDRAAFPFPHSELRLIDITIRMFVEPALILDEQMMHDYLADEIQRKADFLARSEKEYSDGFLDFKGALSSNPKFAALLSGKGVTPPTKQGKNETIFAFAKTDPGFQELLEHETDEIRWLAEARLSVKSTLNETRTERMLKLGEGGRPMPVYHNFYGAHTGRTSGGDKVNFSNLERTSKKDPRKGTIRKALRAPKGHRIVVVDSGQIEARFTAWLAGHDELVRQFASGVDVYSAFASKAFGRPVDRKKNPNDEIPGHIGKCQVLGLGYGMGWTKFAGEMLKGMNGGPVVQFREDDIAKLGVDPSAFLANPKNIERVQAMPSRLGLKDRLIHCAVANHFVNSYRESNPAITQLWKFHDKIIKDMVAGEEYTFHHLGFLRLMKEAVMMPNGLCLKYSGIRKTDDGFTYFDGRGTKHVYGGSLTENFVQALTRTIVMDQARRLHKKYPIKSWSYDELVMVVPESQAGECLHDALEAMKIVPAWAGGLPLAAEGGIGETYGEAKH